MEPTLEQLAQLKQLEIAMLREFVNVCNKLNLRYYLLGGTLLGAVRHQGFIPWDDDIDVGMPREDYNVFLKEGQALLPKYLFIQSLNTEPEYPMCFAKIRNSKTTFVESSIAHLHINHGVYIDVFPLDNYPDGEKEKAFVKKNRFYNRRISMIYRLNGRLTCKQRAISLLMKLWYPNVKTAIQKREKLYRSVRSSGRIANHGGAWGQKEIVPADWYGAGTPVMFEGMELMAPEKYHNWLTQVYGDYMQLPPVEKRVGHHYTDVIDLEKPYTEYIGRT